MNNADLRGIYDELAIALRAKGWGALVDQMDVVAAEGKPQELTKTLVTQEARVHRPSVGDVRWVRLTAGERVAGLLDLVESALLSEVQLKRTIFAELRLLGVPLERDPVIKFSLPVEAEPLEVERDGEWDLHASRGEDAEREAAAEEVAALIAQFRESLALPRGEWLGGNRAVTGGWKE